MKKNKILLEIFSLLISIIIPVGLGALVGFLSGSSEGYKDLILPSFAPPGIVFPILWTILYTLMGLSAYLIKEIDSINKKNAVNTYYVSLIINLIWSFLFFKLKWLLFSALWIILLIYFVIITIIKYYKIKKVASYLQLPYLFWLFFALVLNLTIYFIN